MWLIIAEKHLITYSFYTLHLSMCSPPIVTFSIIQVDVLTHCSEWEQCLEKIISNIRHIWHDSWSLVQLSPAFIINLLAWIIIHIPGLIGYGNIKSTSMDVTVWQKVQQNVHVCFSTRQSVPLLMIYSRFYELWKTKYVFIRHCNYMVHWI